MSSLLLSNSRYDLSNTPNFETEEAATAEDVKRAAMLRSMAAKLPRAEGAVLRRLADEIDPEQESFPHTAASSRYMRERRIHIIGAIWEVIDSGAALNRDLVSGAQCSVFTAIPENWSVPLGMLHTVNPDERMATFRQHLHRSAKMLHIKLEGQLFAALHGAYDPATGTYPFHVHGLATGNFIQAVDGLRMLPKYQPAQPHDHRDAAHTPIYMSRGALTNMPDPLTYVLKRHWLQRETYLGPNGLRKAWGGKPKRLPEPAHTEVLQFLDRWRLEDVTLMMGMSVTKKGLILR